MYGKAFDSMYTGSMCGAGSHVFAVWGYVIANARHADNSIELNPKLLAALIGDPIERIQDALEYLQSPDPNSRSEAEQGRRLVKEGQFLYRVVNLEMYHALKDEDARRDYNREYGRKRRSKEAESKSVNSCQTLSNSVNFSQDSSISSQAPSRQEEVEVEVKEEVKATALSDNNIGLTNKIQTSVPPSKKKRETVQKNGYNAVKLWVDAMQIHAKVGKVRVTGTDSGILSNIGNDYSEYQFRCILKIYAKERAGKPWTVWDLERNINFFYSKIWSLTDYREDLEFPPEEKKVSLEKPPISENSGEKA